MRRISAFKSSVPNGESGDEEIFFGVPKDTKEDGDVSLNADNIRLSYTSGIVNGIAPPPSINEVFRKCLKMLHTGQPSEEVDGILGGMSLRESSATPQESHVEAVWFYLLNMDPMIKIPLLML